MTYETLVYATLASGAFGLVATFVVVLLDALILLPRRASSLVGYVACAAGIGLLGFAVGLVAMIHFAA